MKLKIASLFFFTIYLLPAQVDSIKQFFLDSLKNKFVKDSAHTYRPKKFRLIVGYDSRNSFIRDAPVNFIGLQLGLSYKDKHTMGFGGYKITQSSSRPVKKKDISNRVLNQNLTLNYGTFFYQYTIIDKRFYEVDIPLEIGYGKANIKLYDANSNLLISNRTDAILPVGVGLQLIIKPVKWVGISFMGGYRYVKDNEKRLNFNGWYYSVGVWLDFRQVLRDIKFYGFQRRKYHKALAKYKD